MGAITLHPCILGSTLLDILNRCTHRYFTHSDADIEETVNETIYCAVLFIGVCRL